MTALGGNISWDEIPEGLRDLLFQLYDSAARSHAEDVQTWLGDNIEGCSAELMAATRVDQACYCEELSAPGNDGFCTRHTEEEPYED